MHKNTVIRQIDTGHRVVGHEGKCARIHGHTYTITVIQWAGLHDLAGPGFVQDFGEIKSIIDQWDHKCLLWTEDPLWRILGLGPSPAPWTNTEDGFVAVPFNPTAEHMARHLWGHFALDVSKAAVCVAETESTEAWYTEP